MEKQIEEQKEQRILEIPYLSDDDVKKLTFINNLLLQEILRLIKEETEDGSIQKQV